MTNKTKELKHFMLKLLSFLLLFIIISGIIGPWVIGTRLLYGFYFFIYGNLGKMVIISSIIFILLAREKLGQIKTVPFRKSNALFLFLAFLLIPLFFAVARLLLTYPSFTTNLSLSLSAHTLVILSVVFLAIGVFGLSFIGYFLKSFKKEILICLLISTIYDLAIFQIWKLWPYFSQIVLSTVHLLLSLSFSPVLVIPPRTIIVDTFAVQIEQACSGVDSLFLFSSLYLFIAILDWKKFNKTKLFLMFIPSSLGLFLVNILRVYLLVIIGILISPVLAIKLFHTYAGMVLFILYFLAFWKIFYGWMRGK